MPENQKCGQKIISRNDDCREPADGIAADSRNITVKAVHDITIGEFAHGKPVRIDDLIKDICLDIIINIDTQSGRYPIYNTFECQVEDGTSYHDCKH